ncbi:NADAR family protein [Mariniflexile gromovii]|uniref:NADAR family protein n=1 Tax=Mariniflexile gromovii TaxID=362523 RepID=A0ABS4BZJ1_9FLAO|nr:NADAR family protein [Mariniflexile gromovii]MBP0905878.1 NADAR family protein [Mariniflexile gromovii]
MNYTNEKIIERFESGENLKFLLFWGHTKSDLITKSCFSQWYESKFKVNGVEYQTAEHFMMAEKALLFKDKDIYEQIIKSSKAGKVKELGRKVKNFNQRIWEENRFEIVVRGNFHKFSQNPKLSEFLKNTNERILVEASPVDNIWGIGLAQNNEDAENPYFWNGLNLLGYALMETRDIINKIGEFQALEKPVLPPWLAHPEIDRYSIGWRMGYGEGHIDDLLVYLENLSDSEKVIYELTYPENEEWKGWYKNG